MKKLLIVAIAILFVGGISSTAKAVSLSPGQVDIPITPGGFAPTLPSPVTVSATFSTATYSGNITENVYSGTTDGTVTGMLFEYTFSNNTGSETIAYMSVGGYAGFATDIYATGPGDPPFNLTRSSSGGTLDIYFVGNAEGGVPGGQSSDTIWIQTNAPYYTSNNTTLDDSTATNIPTTLGPTAIPEPATMVMFGIGALGLVGLRKRKVA
jgi:hypothetical protein